MLLTVFNENILTAGCLSEFRRVHINSPAKGSGLRRGVLFWAWTLFFGVLKKALLVRVVCSVYQPNILLFWDEKSRNFVV